MSAGQAPQGLVTEYCRETLPKDRCRGGVLRAGRAPLLAGPHAEGSVLGRQLRVPARVGGRTRDPLYNPGVFADIIGSDVVAAVRAPTASVGSGTDMSTATQLNLSVPGFREFAERVLLEREKSGIRGSVSERNRFQVHLSTAKFADKRLDEVTREDIEAWLDEMFAKRASDSRGARTLSKATIARAYALCAAIFVQAGPEGGKLLKVNPCDGIRWTKRAPKVIGGEKRTYLTFEQQRALAESEAIEECHRLPILFAIGTGLQQGEQFNLRLADVRVDDPEPHVIVRFTANGLPLSSGKQIRRVPLLGGDCPALAATKRWLEVLPNYAPHNPDGLVFPTPTGRVRGVGKPLGRVTVPSKKKGGGENRCAWKDALAKVGLPLTTRWADLRHTCAVSLGSGMWGKPWQLHDVQRMLGLSSLAQVQQYTGMIDQALADQEARAESAAESSERQVRRTKWTAEPPLWNGDGVRLGRDELRASSGGLTLADDVLERTAAALRAGKHILFVGPPGTGKTELAHAVVAAATEAGYCRNAHVATACADWTSFDTIGGYMLGRQGELRFRPGALLRAIEQHQWLIIDELNRADVDRAFGELMTILSNRTSDTNYELEDGRSVRIGPLWDATHRVPPTFRMLATMNTWDKTSLFRLSYAIQRRFAIVDVDVPDDASFAELIRHHALQKGEEPPLESNEVTKVIWLFSSVGLLATRPIGPAVALDVVRYMRTRRPTTETRRDAFAEAVAMFVLPQLESLGQEPARRAHTCVLDVARSVSSEDAVRELHARFAELFPHVRFS